MINGCDFESGSEIYTDGWKALELARSIPDTVYQHKTDLHFMWRVPREFGRKQAACIKSAITTQNLDYINIVLWSNVDLSQNEWIKPIARHIELRIYDPVKEAIGTPLEGMNRILNRDDDAFWLGGDLFRLLILYKYGGIYSDCDIIFLRDLSPLLEQEFLYQWGTEKDKINGAVMRLFKRSKTANDLLTMIPRMPAGFKSTDWGSTLYGEVRKFNKEFTVFPCAFFNTEWQLFINMGESAHPFRCGADSGRDFDGAFTWHWHNKWDDPIEDGSKFQRLESKINDKYAAGFDYVVDRNNRHLGGNYGNGDPNTFFPRLWKWLIKTYNAKTILDIGCGEGFSTEWFAGNCDGVLGVDGLDQNIDRLKKIGIATLCHDFTKSNLVFDEKFDLVWCCEFVEHVDERYVQNFIDTFKCAGIVVMTHGLPGQSGHHHVNCQPSEYWIKKMEENGFFYLNYNTELSRGLSPDESCYAKSGLIFANKNV